MVCQDGKEELVNELLSMVVVFVSAVLMVTGAIAVVVMCLVVVCWLWVLSALALRKFMLATRCWWRFCVWSCDRRRGHQLDKIILAAACEIVTKGRYTVSAPAEYGELRAAVVLREAGALKPVKGKEDGDE